MRDAFFLSLTIVTPLFCWMLLGKLLAKPLRLSGRWLDTANALAFRLFLPLLLFRSIYQSDIRSELGGSTGWLVAYILAGVALSFVLGHVVVPRLIRTPARCGVFIQGALRSNTAVFGLPVAISLYGQENVGLIAMVMAAVVILFNVASVITLERFRHAEGGGGGVKVAALAKGIATNPLIIALVLGLTCNLTGLTLPAGLASTVNGLADCATPFSFVLLGAGISFGALKRDRKALTAAVAIKLVLYPLVWVLGALALGWRGQQLFAVVVIFALPTAISAYPMSAAMQGDTQLCAGIVALTSALSVGTVFLWIFILSSLGIIP